MNSFPYKETLLLFFFTFLTNEVGCAKAEQHGNAAAQRSILVTISTVVRKTRTTLHHTAAFFLCNRLPAGPFPGIVPCFLRIAMLNFGLTAKQPKGRASYE